MRCGPDGVYRFTLDAATTTFGDIVVGGTGEAFAANASSGGGIARIDLDGCP